MGIFGSIMDKIFHHSQNTTVATSTQQGQAPQKTLYISIVEQDKTASGQSKEHKGVWNFKLENADY